MRLRNMLYTLAVALLSISCSEVDICEMEHPHSTAVTFDFDWGGRAADKPDTMGVLSYRVVRQWKELVAVNTDEPIKYDNKDTYKIPIGDFRFFTVSLDSTELDYSELTRFIKNPSAQYPWQEVCLTYRQYDVADPRLDKKLLGWEDFNSYAKYIQPGPNVFFFDTTQVVNIMPDVAFAHTFKPKALSQTVDIYFNIEKTVKGTPFTVDSVWADISGIPCKFNVFSAQLDITKTAKIMFPTTLTAANGSKGDTDKNTRLTCHGKITVPGIVNAQAHLGENEDDARRKINGPGIVQVIIYSHTKLPVSADVEVNPDDPTTYKLLRKKWQGIINIYTPLKRAALLKYSTDGRYVSINKPHGEVRIDAGLKLDGDQIVSDATDEPLEQWIPTSSILVDI